MGLGDNLMAAGMARGAHARGKRIAFGDGQRILWDKNSETVFRHNPNIAKPGSEGQQDLEWVPFYKGNRLYNRQSRTETKWIWNYDFRPTPGEFFFDAHERQQGGRYGKSFILIEPDVPSWKSVAPNKDWGRENYQELADRLRKEGHRVARFLYPRAGPPLKGVEQFRTRDYRDAAAILSHAKLFIGPEGGLHHAAAAVKRRGVVLFGGFIPPSVTGYDIHANLTGGAEACGNFMPCEHCKAALRAISVEEVFEAAREMLSGRHAADRREIQSPAPSGGLPRPPP